MIGTRRAGIVAADGRHCCSIGKINRLALHFGLALELGVVLDNAFHGLEHPGKGLLKIIGKDQNFVRRLLGESPRQGQSAVERGLAALLLLNNGTTVAKAAISVAGLIGLAQKIAEEQAEGGFAQLLTTWKIDLDGLKSKLTTVDGLTGLKDRLTAGWLEIPKAFLQGLKALAEKIEAKPDQTATLDAQTFLTTAQLRLGDYREAMRKNKAAEIACASAKAAYDAYCSVMEDELNTLYDDVQEDFSTFYRAINEDDEVKFTAKLTPSEGRLDFDVNFYDRGLFPPACLPQRGPSGRHGRLPLPCAHEAALRRSIHLCAPGRRGHVRGFRSPLSVLQALEDAFSQHAVHYHHA